MRGGDASRTLKNLTVAVLTPDKNEMQTLDIFCNVSQDITISCVGANEVHMAGYFEPNQDLEAGFDPNELEEDDEEMELEDDDEEPEEIDDAPTKSAALADKKEVKKDKSKDKPNKKEDKTAQLEQRLKDAKKNALKNSMIEEASEDGDEE